MCRAVARPRRAGSAGEKLRTGVLAARDGRGVAGGRRAGAGSALPRSGTSTRAGSCRRFRRAEPRALLGCDDAAVRRARREARGRYGDGGLVGPSLAGFIADYATGKGVLM